MKSIENTSHASAETTVSCDDKLEGLRRQFPVSIQLRFASRRITLEGGIAWAWRGGCPFCNQRAHSFLLWRASSGVYRSRCFSCGFEGDVFAFVRKFDRCSHDEAIQAVRKETERRLRDSAPVSDEVEISEVNPQLAARTESRGDEPMRSWEVRDALSGTAAVKSRKRSASRPPHAGRAA